MTSERELRPHVGDAHREQDPMNFSIQERPTGTTVIELKGELDITTVDELKPSLDDLIARRSMRVEFDLSRLRMIDSIGTGLLVGFYKRMRAHCGTVALRAADGQPLAILKLIHVDRVLVQP
jgi:anti-sigma B factor antagonist